MSIATISRRAKSIRKAHPSLTWQQALKKSAAHGTGSHKKRTVRRKMSGTSSVGSTSVGRTRRKTRKKAFGIFGTSANVQHIGMTAVGVAAGTIAMQKLVRPLEMRLVQRFPAAQNFMPVAEIFVGGMISAKSKGNAIVNGAGYAVLGAGVAGLMQQLRLGSGGVHGLDNSMTLVAPMSGMTRTDLVSGFEDTSWVSGFTKTEMVSGIGMDTDTGYEIPDMPYLPKGTTW